MPEGTSVNQLISLAVAEKLAALSAEDYLVERGRHASRKKFEAALRTVPDLEPDKLDRIAPRTALRRGTGGGDKECVVGSMSFHLRYNTIMLRYNAAAA